MVKQRDINQLVESLKLNASAKYNIAPDKCHIGHFLLQGMLENPDDLNQIDGATDARETNISVAVRTCRLASAMANSGMKPGDPVILSAPSHLDVCIPFFACHFNGYPFCGIDHTVSTPADLNALFPYIRPKMVFCQKSNLQSIKDALASSKSDAQIIVFDDPTRDLEHYIQNNDGTELDYRPEEFDHSETTAWLMLTSGTTGQPKVSVVPFDRLLNSICCWWTGFTDVFEITLVMGNVQWLSSLMHYVSGPLLGYTRLQSSEPLNAQRIVGLINKYRPNVTAWTPHLLGQFLIATGNVCDLSSFRYIAIGGSAIDKSLVDRFREKCNAFLYLVYGMTELLVPVFDFDEDTPFGSTGKPSPKYQFKLIDDDDQIVNEPHKNGELWIKGDAFFKGYLNNPEETKTILTEDGWFKTGDIFYRDEQDFYYFVERKKILIRHYRLMIAPLQLEEVIRRHPGVLEACVVGVPDPECVELPVGAILRKNNVDVDPQEIFDLLKKELPETKQLRGGLFFLDSFPITPSGKVNRGKIKDMALVTPRIMSH